MTWMLREAELAITDEDALATLFAVGNGQFCTRGTLAEQRYESFRGTYISGLFTRAGYGLPYFLAGPDPLPAWLTVHNQAPTRTASDRLLDLREAVLHRTAAFSAGKGKFSIHEQRFASLDVSNQLVQQIQLTIESSAPAAQLHLALDGDTHNHPAKYYQVAELPNCTDRGLKLSQVTHCQAGDGALEVAIESAQTGSGIEAVAFVKQTAGDELPLRYEVQDGRAVAVIDLPDDAPPASSYTFCKQVFLYPYQDHDPLGLFDSTIYDEAMQLAAETDYRSLRDAHVAQWADFWEAADVEIEGDDAAQRAVRYALYSTRMAAPDDDGESSLSAKNLTGDWYRGAVFWDTEMFQLPLLASVAPELAANHILYRTNRIDAARTLASQDGYAGARFPWQSYRSGLEDPPVIGGFLYQQVHINAAVAWGICHYYDLTGDDALLLDGALELLLELGKYWLSRCQEGDDGLLHIRTVCGPGEVHKSVDDNAYTNVLAAHVLRRTSQIIDQLSAVDAESVQRIVTMLDLQAEEVADWPNQADRIATPRLEDGTLAQFAGFQDAAQPNPAMNDHAGHSDPRDNTNKQADTLMIFQALPGSMQADQLAKCYQTYAPLCHQTSSLSLCTHALLAARLGLLRDTKRYFETTIGIDLGDQAGNTCHGLHAAAEGGIWLAIVQGYGGMQVRDGQVHLIPRLPDHWESLTYRFKRHGQPVKVSVSATSATVENAGPNALQVWIDQEPVEVAAGLSHTWNVKQVWHDQPLQAVILALDGVLVSTDFFHYRAWKELADEIGLAFDEHVNQQLGGVSREESLRRIYAHSNTPLPNEQTLLEQMTSKNERYKQFIGQLGPDDVLDGAVELLDQLRQAGIKTALASASRNAPVVVELTGLAGKLDAIIDGSVVTHAKPDPQGFYTAAQRLGVLPWNCIGIEDAASGVEAIQRAGMVSVGIGEQAHRADICFDSVAQLSLAKLQEIFKTHSNPINPYLERNVHKAANEAGQ